MATVFFCGLDQAEVIEVEFLTPQGTSHVLRLLVDSGFTGRSSVVLDLRQARFPAPGMQKF